MKSSNSQFTLICKPSNLRHHICINSCLILFCLACLHPKLTFIYHMWQDLLYLRLCTSISHLIHKTFTCHFESHHRSKQAFANTRAFISIMNTLLYFPFLVLLVTYTLYQGINTLACNTWAISFNTHFIIKYMFMISCKQVSTLIVLSINTPKPTRGLDAFISSISCSEILEPQNVMWFP